MKVYYNAACPVCRAGIAHQRRRTAGCEWLDIDADPAPLASIGADREFVRERLHVEDEAGRVHVGIDAFAELWSRTPGQRWLAALVRFPVVHTLSRWGYNGFARALYRWNVYKRRW